MLCAPYGLDAAAKSQSSRLKFIEAFSSFHPGRPKDPFPHHNRLTSYKSNTFTIHWCVAHLSGSV